MASGKKNIPQKQIQVRKSQPPLVSNIQQPTFNITSHKYFIPAIIFLLCLLLYGNTLQNGYAGDDHIYTYDNTFISKGFSAIKDIFDKGSLYGFNVKKNSGAYRPLILLSFMAESSIFGFNPHISHFFNILFFALTVVVLYFFLQKILKNYNRAIIIAAVLLFAFHPIHTEVVANIKSRDEILGFLFGLISFYFLILHSEQNKNSYYIYSIAAFFAALLCKENCLTFIVIIPLLLYFFTGLKIKKIAFTSIPYIAVVVIYLFIRSLVLRHITTNQISVMENALMAAGNIGDMTATCCMLLGKYMYMTIIPYPLSVDYSYNQIPIVSWGNINAILSLLVYIAMFGFMIWGLRKKSIFSFLIALFFITLFVSSNLIVKIGSTFGERFLYTPSLSFCIALPILTARLLRLDPGQIIWKKNYFYIPLACLLIVYTIIVIPRNAEWKNNFTLFSSGTITSPNSGMTHWWLATIYLDSAQNSQKNRPARLKYYSFAAHEFKKATEAAPLYMDCYYLLGECYYNEGNQDSAIVTFKKALELKPKYLPPAKKLVRIYLNKGQNDSALSYLLLLFRSDSNDLDVLRNLGGFYENEKNYTRAFHYDSLVLKHIPDDKQTLFHLSFIHNIIGMRYSNNNELDKALKEYSIALQCDSNSVNAIGNMGVIYQKKGNIEMAKFYYRKALSIDPKNEAFIGNLQMLNRGR